MLMILMNLALANDVFPGLGNPSAVPMKEGKSVAVEAVGAWTGQGLLGDFRGGGLLISADFDR